MNEREPSISELMGAGDDLGTSEHYHRLALAFMSKAEARRNGSVMGVTDPDYIHYMNRAQIYATLATIQSGEVNPATPSDDNSEDDNRP